MVMISDTFCGELETRLGHHFANSALLNEALTHSSVAEAARPGEDFERLEFLGDRVLGLVVADLLMERFPDDNEGDLSRRLVALVRGEALSKIAKDMDLGRFLILSQGEVDQGGRDHPSILADSLEAVIAALYLDGGLEAAKNFIGLHWASLIESITANPPTDAKTALQEWAMARGLALPVYTVTDREGPDHAPQFTVEVSLAGHVPATGIGANKRAAEQAASALLLANIEEKSE